MQPTKFIKVTSDSHLRKDEWINSKFEEMAMSRTRRLNPVLPETSDRNRILSSGLRLTDQPVRTHSIISNSDDPNWAVNLRVTRTTSNASNASNTRGFTLNRNTMTVARTSEEFCEDRSERIYTSFSKRRRVRSEQKISSPKEDKYSRASVNMNDLKAKITQAHLYKKRVINVIQLVHEGIRWKLNNCFIEVGTDLDPVQMRESLSSIRKGLHYNFRLMYMFHLNREPLPTLQQLHRKEYSIFVHRLPKLDVSVEVYFYLSQQIRVLEGALRQAESDLGILHEDSLPVTEPVDIQGYVNSLIDNPHHPISITPVNRPVLDKELIAINDWYSNGMRQMSRNSQEKQS